MGRDPINIGPDADLHLYMDGEMDAARRIAFEAHLAANPALAARLHDYLHQREMLKLGLDMARSRNVDFAWAGWSDTAFVTTEFMTENAMHRFNTPHELEEFLMGE